MFRSPTNIFASLPALLFSIWWADAYTTTQSEVILYMITHTVRRRGLWKRVLATSVFCRNTDVTSCWEEICQENTTKQICCHKNSHVQATFCCSTGLSWSHWHVKWWHWSWLQYNVQQRFSCRGPVGPGFLEAFQVLLCLDELGLKGFRGMCSLHWLCSVYYCARGLFPYLERFFNYGEINFALMQMCSLTYCSLTGRAGIDIRCDGWWAPAVRNCLSLFSSFSRVGLSDV